MKVAVLILANIVAFLWGFRIGNDYQEAPHKRTYVITYGAEPVANTMLKGF